MIPSEMRDFLCPRPGCRKIEAEKQASGLQHSFDFVEGSTVISYMLKDAHAQDDIKGRVAIG